MTLSLCAAVRREADDEQSRVALRCHTPPQNGLRLRVYKLEGLGFIRFMGFRVYANSGDCSSDDALCQNSQERSLRRRHALVKDLTSDRVVDHLKERRRNRTGDKRLIRLSLTERSLSFALRRRRRKIRLSLSLQPLCGMPLLRRERALRYSELAAASFNFCLL